MTATDELRRMLDERGVEWTYKDGTVRYESNGHWHLAWAYNDDKMVVSMGYLTPEQAIDATLGAGTCRWEPADFITEGEWWNTECGGSFTWEPDGTPNYCPNCGREVER